MRLQDAFFELLSMRDAEGGFEADVRLIPDSVIFRAHFPGFPVTPGAVQVRMATELLSLHDSRDCRLQSAQRVKFIAPLLPGDVITCSFKGNSVSFTREGSIITKMTLGYR
ncbi:MAG: hypothetical protein J6Z47_08225 [Bacteroidales bacterium]|nr:hypothetical protein [Bacteroidales bacterium]